MFKVEDFRFLPTRQTHHSAGFDVRSREIVCCHPNRIAFVPTGVWIDQNSSEWHELCENHFIGLYIRSSLARAGLMLANGTGIIDLDYKDEIVMMIYNVDNEPYTILDGDRIGQLIIHPHANTQISECWNGETVERIGGFGSTGKN